MRALTSFVRKPGFSSLPQVYMKAGSALLVRGHLFIYFFPLSNFQLLVFIYLLFFLFFLNGCWRCINSLQDIVQSRPSRFPISSQDLFSILDDASEKTFLCAGTAESMQKYVFDGEAGKIGLEMKNLVACTCFLVEQKLVFFFLFSFLLKLGHSIISW